MKTVSDIFQRNAAWVDPNHDVATVILLMHGKGVSGLPVMAGGRLVGMVLHKHLLGVEPDRRVEEIMDATLPVLPLSLSLHNAVDLMTSTQSECLPVVDDEGVFLGVLYQTALLAALRRPLDPLTELPWSDQLREWAVQRLQVGQEITLLFIDVNDFGLFNKRYGHVVGDAILQRIAKTLQECTDPNRDIVCRYGGDEFAIASLRTAPEAEALAKQIEDEVSQRAVTQADGERIGITVGWHGGQRTHERDHVHYMATVNNLINLASKKCLVKKKSSQEADRVSPVPEAYAHDFSAPLNAPTGLPLPLRTSLPLPLIDIKQEDRTTSIQIKWQTNA